MTIAGLVLHVLLQSGVAAGTANGITPRDNSVMAAVLNDLLTAKDSPVNSPFVQSKPLLFAAPAAQFRLVADHVLPLKEKRWAALTPSEQERAREAAERVAERSDSAGGEFLVVDRRIRLCRGDERTTDGLKNEPLDAFPPGFSTDGLVAVVAVRIPWSIHSVSGNYIMVFESGRWKVLIRHFIYYL